VSEATESERGTSIGVGLLLTAAAWLLSRLVVGVFFSGMRSPLAWKPTVWAHWDALNYLSIASNGQQFVRCGPKSVYVVEFHQQWCGNVLWLPGYPWLIRGAQALGIAPLDGAVIISWVALAATLFVLWVGWGRNLHPGRAFLLLLLFGVFPGAVYNFASFPMSTTLLFMVGGILAATRERFLLAAVLMTAAGLCYPGAWAAAAGLAVGLVLLALPLGLGTAIRRSVWGLAGLTSILILGIFYQIDVGHFDAYFLADRGLTPTLGEAIRRFYDLVFVQKSVEQKPLGALARLALSVQAVLALALGVVALVAAWLQRRQADVVYPALAAGAVILTLPIASNSSGWNRSVVLAAPCVACLRRLPIPLLCVTIGAVGLITAILSHSYFTGALR